MSPDATHPRPATSRVQPFLPRASHVSTFFQSKPTSTHGTATDHHNSIGFGLIGIHWIKLASETLYTGLSGHQDDAAAEKQRVGRLKWSRGRGGGVSVGEDAEGEGGQEHRCLSACYQDSACCCSSADFQIKDLTLPKSMIARLAKGVLPANTQIQKDALLALHKSATVFVSYIAST